MAINKVNANGRTLIDLTGDTVTPETLMEGMTAHNSKGDLIVGTMPEISLIKETKTGEVIYADDVLNTEHVVDVKVTGGNNLEVLGGNLFPINEMTVIPNKYFAQLPDKEFLAKVNKLPRMTDLFLSSDFVGESNGGLINALAFYINNDFTYAEQNEAVQLPEGEIKKVFFYGGKTHSEAVKMTNIQVSVKPQTYEPYKEPITYPINADGTVDNVKSVSPNMTIRTDAAGAIITATYIADTKKYIDNKVLEVQKGVLANV